MPPYHTQNPPKHSFKVFIIATRPGYKATWNVSVCSSPIHLFQGYEEVQSIVVAKETRDDVKKSVKVLCRALLDKHEVLIVDAILLADL